MVSLYADAIAIPSNDINADKIVSFLQDKVPCKRHIIVNWCPTKLESPSFSGGLGNELYPTTNGHLGSNSTNEGTGGECIQTFWNGSDDSTLCCMIILECK